MMHPHICLKHSLQLWMATFSSVAGSRSRTEDYISDEIRNCYRCRAKMMR